MDAFADRGLSSEKARVDLVLLRYMHSAATCVDDTAEFDRLQLNPFSSQDTDQPQIRPLPGQIPPLEVTLRGIQSQ